MRLRQLKFSDWIAGIQVEAASVADCGWIFALSPFWLRPDYRYGTF
jgi:hypothetical protein